MRPFLRRFDVRSLPSRHGVLHALLGAYAAWGGDQHKTPRIAILDWREVPTYNEFVLWVDFFRARGLEARIVDPRNTEFHAGRGGRLVADGEPIDLIYKRVLISELVERGGPNHPVIRAVQSGFVLPLDIAASLKVHVPGATRPSAQVASLSSPSNAWLRNQNRPSYVAPGVLRVHGR